MPRNQEMNLSDEEIWTGEGNSSKENPVNFAKFPKISPTLKMSAKNPEIEENKTTTNAMPEAKS